MFGEFSRLLVNIYRVVFLLGVGVLEAARVDAPTDGNWRRKL